jgi:hypothetical protein
MFIEQTTRPNLGAKANRITCSFRQILRRFTPARGESFRLSWEGEAGAWDRQCEGISGGIGCATGAPYRYAAGEAGASPPQEIRPSPLSRPFFRKQATSIPQSQEREGRKDFSRHAVFGQMKNLPKLSPGCF